MLIKLLGPVEVAHKQGWSRGGTPKQACVLASLALAPNTVLSIDVLAHRIWGADAPAEARNVLYGHVSRLRQALGTHEQVELRRAGGSGYVLDIAPTDVDVSFARLLAGQARAARAQGDVTTAARHWREVVGLWQGQPLSGVAGGWAERTRRKLRDEHVAALAALGECGLELGRHAEVAADLEAAAERFPLAENLVEQLMLALYRCGRHAEALAWYTDTRTRVREEFGSEPGKPLRTLHQRILRQDPALLLVDAPTVDATESPAWTAICQLPPDIADFVGRERELDTLTATVLRRGGGAAPAIATVHGTPGVGKSTLAVRVAHRLRPHYPDGQLFLDLGGAAPAPRDPSTLLAELLRSLHVEPAAIPETLAERTALYRSTVADRAILLVLDDAADEEQVRPLLPGTAHSAVLVTSRHHLVLDGATATPLDLLTRCEAFGLLAQVTGGRRVEDDRASAEIILDACGQLPLAIRVAGARLAARPTWPLRALADRLADASDRLDELSAGQHSVRASFAVSYAALPAAARRAFRLLGPAGFETIAEWSVEALLCQPRDVTDAAIEALVVAGLLTACEANPAGEPRYRMHDLLRAYACDRARVEEDERHQRTALRRLVAECLHRVRSAVRDLSHPFAPPPGPSACGGAGYEWLAAERHNLVAAVRLAAETGHPDIAVELAYHLTAYLKARGYYDDVVRVQQAAMAAGDAHQRMRCRLILAELDVDRARYGAALSEFEELSRHFEQTGDRHAAAYARTGRAACRHALGDHENTIAELDRAVSVLRAAGDSGGAVYALLVLRSVHLEAGRYADAIAVSAAALELTAGRASLDRAWVLRGLGIAYYETGQVETAVRYYEESLALARHFDCDGGARKTLRRLGEAYGALGRFEEATETLTMALTRFVRSGDVLGEALTAYAFGELCHRQGRGREALAHFTRCAELIGPTGSRTWRIRALREIGRARAGLGDRAAAVAAWTEALALCRDPHSAEAREVAHLLTDVRQIHP
ncbi:AfsR/SARP family transcriptional regulator [Phytohabitans aurantiacus]|uniref:SARP family transcriptional regulator n=1 Tax=Phytohabitans aurantiacus TaxID=3016789 RepID=A0ABQ5QWM4_9ACTN|nr:BTAD domain-containing putative transcriptional regulator [Phytohabitans aurantiacus]GLH98690.1 SARP family transcriptional regulator [Phytohabitans aurantiacus]